MNQDQVKQFLLSVRDTDEYFDVVLSGKSSDKVDGLYKPQSREIVIHNKNMRSENELKYTALHEYAHHLHMSKGGVKTSRAHTTEFWSVFHDLLDRAEASGAYSSVYAEDEELSSLTRRIRKEFLGPSGSLLKEFGRLLLQAKGVCERLRIPFEDYMDRELGVHRSDGLAAIRASVADLSPGIGWDNMKVLGRIKDFHAREEAQNALMEGASPDGVRQKYLIRKKPPWTESPAEDLRRERDRIRKMIASLEKKLEEIESLLEKA